LRHMKGGVVHSTITESKVNALSKASVIAWTIAEGTRTGVAPRTEIDRCSDQAIPTTNSNVSLPAPDF